MKSSGARLREGMARGLVQAPGASGGMSAKLVEQAGFPAVYLGSGTISATVFGRPDVELMTLSELMIIVKAVCEVVQIPVVVDADTGFGGIHNVMRTVREMEDAGVAAIHLEDQPVPKRCGYFDGGALLPVNEMCEKIDAALDARRDDNFVVIARVDAAFIKDFSEAIDRASAYRDAGADMVFVNGMTTVGQAKAVIDGAPGMHLYNVSGSDRAPLLTAKEIEDLGYRLAIYPLHDARLAGLVTRRMLADLKEGGTIKPWLQHMLSFEEWQGLSGALDVLEVEKRYAAKWATGPDSKGR